jgi:hypothetical protein
VAARGLRRAGVTAANFRASRRRGRPARSGGFDDLARRRACWRAAPAFGRERRRPHGSLLFRSLSPVNRDRGEPRGSSPPTPPCVRVRTRRFGGLSLPPCGRTDRGFVSRIAAAASVPVPPGRRASPSGLGGQAGQYRSSAAWPPRDACRYSPLPPFGPSSGRPDCRVGGGALSCLRADLRPPLKRNVQFSRIPLS